MFINNFDPVAFQVFSFEIRWYSLAYIFGLLLGWYLCKKIFISDDEIKQKFDDYITYLILGIIIGGRLGYVIFYNFDYYLKNPIDVLVGNGSKVKVLYKPFEWKFAGKSGTSLDLQAVQVIDLVPYGEDFDVSDGYVAEGNNEEF